jgi:hypothetical protein
MRAQGWYPDPDGGHDERWFSDGEPTSLVRDQGTESYDELPRGQSPAWHWWTVWLPGVAALLTTLFIFVVAGLASVLNNCFDTCGAPAPPPGASALSAQELILFAVALVLLAAGAAVPPWRRVSAYALWTAIALAIALVPLHVA